MNYAYQRHTAGAALLLGLALIPSAGQADAIEDFYKSASFSIVTSTGAGGPYDTVARSMARHMPRHLPGHPTMIVRNMPGGGNVRATNYMYVQAPKDGATIASIGNAMPLQQVLDGRGIQFDARKFNWLGSVGSSNLLSISWSKLGITSIEQTKTRETIAGGTGVGSGSVLYPVVMNNVLGTKFKVVIGYNAYIDVVRAMERGEVDSVHGGSYAGLKTENPDWLRDKKVNVLVQVGSHRDPELPDVPLMSELAKTPDDKLVLELISSPVAVGRPYLAPPGVPEARVAALTKAFAETMTDPLFIAESKKLQFDLDPISGKELGDLITRLLNAPEDVLNKARAAIVPKDKIEGGKEGGEKAAD